MSTATSASLVTLSDYDHMVFEHDAEYVEGEIVYRPMPTPAHSLMQALLAHLLFVVARQFGFEVLSELRIRTRPDRTRIPDVCLTRGVPTERVPTIPPYLCIEILSPDDLMTETLTKIDEYLTMGVEYVWVIDPVELTGEIYSTEAVKRVRDGIFTAGMIEVNVRSVPT